jgi:hypothetical protein
MNVPVVKTTETPAPLDQIRAGIALAENQQDIEKIEDAITIFRKWAKHSIPDAEERTAKMRELAQLTFDAWRRGGVLGDAVVAESNKQRRERVKAHPACHHTQLERGPDGRFLRAKERFTHQHTAAADGSPGEWYQKAGISERRGRYLRWLSALPEDKYNKIRDHSWDIESWITLGTVVSEAKRWWDDTRRGAMLDHAVADEDRDKALQSIKSTLTNASKRLGEFESRYGNIEDSHRREIAELYVELGEVSSRVLNIK